MHANLVRHPSFGEPPLPGPADLRSIALLLDVDGTILDTAITPNGVVVSGALRSSLKELHAKSGGALALVSGRLIKDLDNLFAPLRLPSIGGHGAEMRLEGSLSTRARHADTIGEAFCNLVAAAAAIDPRVILEDKGTSLALHYRLAPEVEEALKTKVDALVSRVSIEDLEVMHGKAVIEIKSTHFSKGVAVRELMESPPFLHRKPVFIGDDTTDLSVFKILPMLGGLGYSVGRLMPGVDGTFVSPHEVRSWLASLCGREGNGRE